MRLVLIIGLWVRAGICALPGTELCKVSISPSR